MCSHFAFPGALWGQCSAERPGPPTDPGSCFLRPGGHEVGVSSRKHDGTRRLCLPTQNDIFQCQRQGHGTPGELTAAQRRGGRAAGARAYSLLWETAPGLLRGVLESFLFSKAVELSQRVPAILPVSHHQPASLVFPESETPSGSSKYFLQGIENTC